MKPFSNKGEPRSLPKTRATTTWHCSSFSEFLFCNSFFFRCSPCLILVFFLEVVYKWRPPLQIQTKTPTIIGSTTFQVKYQTVQNLSTRCFEDTPLEKVRFFIYPAQVSHGTYKSCVPKGISCSRMPFYSHLKGFLKICSSRFSAQSKLTNYWSSWLISHIGSIPQVFMIENEQYLQPPPGGNIYDTSFKHQIWRSFWHQGDSWGVQSKPWQFPKQIDARCSRVSIMYVFRTLLDISALVVHVPVPKTAVYFRVNVGNQTKVS